MAKLFAPVEQTMTKITDYRVLGKLPDPFLSEDGARLTDPTEWQSRRKEIYRHAVELQYGTIAPAPEVVEIEMLHSKPHRARGVAYVHAGTKEKKATFKIHFVFPLDRKEGERFPTIITGDACWEYYMNKDYIDAALEQRCGFVFFDRTELAHDLRSEGRGHGQLYDLYPDETFGAVGAWAWGYSRVVDALEKSDIPYDPDWIIFTGHSRGAKTAALAGALDERARIVNPNNTCAGACGCYRVHMDGQYLDDEPFRSETLKDLYDKFGFWIGEGMGEYRECEEKLPFDTHFLKAMIAPRVYYESNAAGDIWSNPVGSWQSDRAAFEVWKFLGVPERFIWSWRIGYHDQTPHDISMLCNVLHHVKDGEPLYEDQFFRVPFDPADFEPIFDWKAPEPK